MLDALHIDNLPDVGWDLLACYVNGALPESANNYATARLRFPNAQILTITVNGALVTADVCDCESGDYTPQAAAAWAAWMIGQGRRPTVYASRSTWPLVVAELANLGVSAGAVDWWATTLDNTMGPSVTCTNGTAYPAVAVQYTDTGGYDVSVVYDDGWHPAAVPAPAGPFRLLEDSMYLIVCTTDGFGLTHGSQWVYIPALSHWLGISGPPDDQQFAAVLPVLRLTAAQIRGFPGTPAQAA